MKKLFYTILTLIILISTSCQTISFVTNNATIASWKKFDDSSLFYGKIVHDFDTTNQISLWLRKKDNIYYHAKIVLFDNNEKTNERYFMFEAFPDNYIIETFIAETNSLHRKRLKPVLINKESSTKPIIFNLSDHSINYVGTWKFSPSSNETDNIVYLEIIDEKEITSNYFIERCEPINDFQVTDSLPDRY